MRARICTMLVALTLAACSSTRQSDQAPHSAVSLSGVYKLGTPYQINGRWYYPKYDPNYDEVGVASWYGDAFHGRLTANGEIFDKDTISAAHPTLPLPSYVRVTNLDNGRSMVIRVNDRGPFVDDRLIDLSEAAARNLGFRSAGLARVRVAFLDLAEARGTPPLPTVSPPPVEVAQAPAKPRTAPERPVAAVPKVAPRDVEGSLQLASSGPTVEPKVGWGSTAPAACGLGPQFVQVAAFSDPGRAKAAVRALQDLEHVRLEPVFIGDRAAARVRLGPVDSYDAAILLLDRVRRLGYADAFVAPARQMPASIDC